MHIGLLLANMEREMNCRKVTLTELRDRYMESGSFELCVTDERVLGYGSDGRQYEIIAEEGNSILDGQYSRLGVYKAVQFGKPQFGPKGWRQRIVFLWGTDIWFGKWPFCKCMIAANVLVWGLMWQ